MNDLLRHIRTALASHTAREVMVFGFFVQLSAAAWLMQVLHESYDVDVSIPLALNDVPEGVVITDSIPHEITVKVNDRGTTLMSFFLGSKADTVRLSFADYNTSRPVGAVRIPTTDLQKHIQATLPITTNIVRMLGDSILFRYNRGVSRRLPVALSGTYTAQQHSYVHSVRIVPDSVTVYAPMQVLDTMTCVSTTPIDMRDLKADTKFNAQMINQEAMCCIPNKVAVQLHIDSYTEKTVEVPIVGVNFPAGKQLRTFPSKVNVTFRVGTAYYNSVTPDKFVIAVSYEDLIRTNRCRLRLKSIPPQVSNAHLSQLEVEYLIEQTAE